MAYQPVPRLDPRVEILEGAWPGEAETRNAGIQFLSDCEYIIGIDTDEIFSEEDLAKIADVCREDSPEVVSVPLHTYWKTPQYRIDPPEPGVIPLVLRRDRKYQGLRGVSGKARVLDAHCHHLSYVRSDLELEEKLRTWGHARDLVPGWYEKVWKAWDADHGLENLHPVHPVAYARAIECPDREVAQILERWGCR